MPFILSNDRYEEIKETVVRVFEKLDINCTPISGFEIATKMETKVIPYSAKQKTVRELMFKESQDGFSLLTESGQWIIYYNDDRSYGRINNTIMHENAHIILDHTEDSELAEAEANFFAKFALAPPMLIYKFGLKNFVEVSERFGITYEAAIYAWNYYQKRLRYGGKSITNYEKKLCRLFGIAV